MPGCRTIKLVLLLLLMIMPVMAQNNAEQELARKYSQRGINSYQVRAGVLMNVSFNDKKQISYLQIVSQRPQARLITATLINELVEDIIPAKQRGQLLSDGNGKLENGWQTITYQHVIMKQSILSQQGLEIHLQWQQ